MNSRDLCMLDKLPDLIDAGISSLKIEGRMKSPFYVATVVSAYRAALDEYLEDPDNYTFQEKWYKLHSEFGGEILKNENEGICNF